MSRRRSRAVMAVLIGLASLGACRSTARAPEVPSPEPVPVAAASPPTPAAEAAAAGVTIATSVALEPAIASRHDALSADARRALPPDEVGYYMDIQQARLQQIGVDGLSVARDGPAIVLTLVGEPAFESGSSRLTPGAETALADVGAVLADYDKTVVSVHGHTDATGSEAANRALSERRALAVSRILMDRGVAALRLVVVGHGPARPVAPNDTEDGRRRNRRIEIRLEPIGGEPGPSTRRPRR